MPEVQDGAAAEPVYPSDAALMDDAQIRFAGIEALNKALGPAGALRFLTLLHREPTDYVEISRRLYDGQTVSDILERASRRDVE